MTKRPVRRKPPMTPKAWGCFAVVCVPLVVLLVVFAVGVLRGGSSGSASGDSLAIHQLDAEMAVTSQSYTLHVQDGDAIRAQSDHEKLLGDCDTARTIGLGAGTASTAIRGVCQTLGATLP